MLIQLIRFFLKTKLVKFAQQVNEAAKEQQRAQNRNADGSINVDHIPPSQRKRRQKDIKGGEYVDYEEVKD
ncbi:DUF4834 family protein [Algoriphagus sp. C2-7]|uniref:DUF4834 family protein n=1 Tax=Algoriphagus sediminis TaxID=3057113 RepID=A0ABT7YFE0_9BACT|nr:DUF4834 family protein [Algoriphagus sediminis]MDN3205212.1 DUF4834 family protein [Algoriphagus sediminis]